MPEKVPLVDKYVELVDKFQTPDTPTNTFWLDQNIALIHDWANEVGLDLRDEETLKSFTLAHIVITAWDIGHVLGTCTEPSCAKAAIRHVQAAAGHLGNHLREIQENL